MRIFTSLTFALSYSEVGDRYEGDLEAKDGELTRDELRPYDEH
jgi:hypothetical protein